MNTSITQKEMYQTIIQGLAALGACIGSFFAGPLAKIGRWKCLIFTNIFVIVGSILCLVPKEISFNFYIFVIGIFIFGISSGSFSVFCTIYINEMAPLEIKGSAGAITQISVTFGSLIPFAISLIWF